MSKKESVKVTRLGDNESLFGDSSHFGKTAISQDRPYVDAKAKTDEIAPPAYSYENLALVPETDDVVYSNIRAIVQNVTGFGFRFEQYEGDEKAFEAQKAMIEGLFNKPNENYESFVVISKLISIDRETFGTGYMEVRRDLDKVIKRIYHSPAFRIRARKDRVVEGEIKVERRGYVLLSGKAGDTKPIMYFKNFGDERDMNMKTGEYGKVDGALRASELIEFKHYNTKTAYYGIPQYISTESAVIGNNYAATTNNNRFKNNCVPDQLIIVNNGSIVSGKKELNSYFKDEFKGSENAGKSLLIEVEGYDKDAIKDGLEKATVQVVPLNKWNDSDFSKFQERNDLRIRRTFRLSKIILGETDDVNRASATAAKEVAEEQVFNPIRIEMDEIINQTIVADILNRNNVSGTPAVWFSFVKMSIDDSDLRIKRAETMNGTGVGTINEIREELGLPAFGEDSDPIYNTPIRGLQMMMVAEALSEGTEAVKTAQMSRLTEVFKSDKVAEAYKMILAGYGVIGGKPRA
jgi:capsid portal protein